MFQDLDESIKALLDANLNETDISFASPDKLSGNVHSISKPTVNLFLYDIRENHELRSNEWQHERQRNGSVRRHRPPVRVDCSYLITVWLNDDASETGVTNEHRLLGEVMKSLMRHRTLPAGLLQGELQGQTPPTRARTIQPGNLQSLGEFWQAMGSKPKASLNYTVTLAVDLTEPEELGPAVTEKVIKIKQGVEDGGT
ncbi:MAG: DUF4255 domain-containing protein [Rhodobacteraceae bacterium]|nr:DUF4255 domain-containing protein [Paracoccaceae bacterium]